MAEQDHTWSSPPASRHTPAGAVHGSHASNRTAPRRLLLPTVPSPSQTGWQVLLGATMPTTAAHALRGGRRPRRQHLCVDTGGSAWSSLAPFRTRLAPSVARTATTDCASRGITIDRQGVLFVADTAITAFSAFQPTVSRLARGAAWLSPGEFICPPAGLDSHGNCTWRTPE